MLSAVLVLEILKIPKVSSLTDKQWKRMRKRMIRNTILILLPSIPLTVIMLSNAD